MREPVVAAVVPSAASSVDSDFVVLRGRRIAKKKKRKCVKCERIKIHLFIPTQT